MHEKVVKHFHVHYTEDEEIPIRATQNFETLLESRLRLEDACGEFHPKCNEEKRPFVRKGQGLARFNVTRDTYKLRKHIKPTTKGPSVSAITSALHLDSQKTTLVSREELHLTDLGSCQAETSEGYGMQRFQPAEGQCGDAPLVVPTWARVLQHRTEPKQTTPSVEATIFDRSKDSIEASFDKKNKRENDELRIFELLEHRTSNSSFCSSSSTVLRLMEESVKSTPIKATRPAISRNGEQNACDHAVGKQLVSGRASEFVEQSQGNVTGGVPPREFGTDRTVQWSKECVDTSLHVQFADIACSDGLSHDGNASGGFDDNRTWSGECSCESELSDSSDACSELRRNTGDVDPLVKRKLNTTCREDVASKRKVDLSFGDHSFEMDSDQASDATQTILDCRLGELEVQQNNEAHGTIPQVVRHKLEELEQEIRVFKAESGKMAKVRCEYEERSRRLAQERAEWEKQGCHERESAETYIAQERQKLANEKRVFEKYTKDFKQRRSKEEREEIKSLKVQLAAVEGKLKEKQSQFAASQSRASVQLRQMKTANEDLRRQLDACKEADSKRASRQNKVYRLSNTRLLHRLNKEIGQLKPADIEEYIPATSSELTACAKKSKPAARTSKGDKNPPLSILTLKRSKSDIGTSRHKKSIEFEASALESDNRPTDLLDVRPIIVHSTNHTDSETLDLLGNHKAWGITRSYLDGLNAVNETDFAEITREKTKSSSKDVEGHMEISDGEGDNHDANKRDIGTMKTRIYSNGDIKETDCKTGTVRYFYASSHTWHTTLANGQQILEFLNGQKEKHHTDGTKEVSFPDGSMKISYADGSEEWKYPDGASFRKDISGEKMYTFANGEKEFHTAHHKRRLFLDGSEKYIYPDGTQETHYKDGRIRIRHCDGKIVMSNLLLK